MSTALQANYDVVIVGARPAGASLAARLGAAGVSVLIVDKAEFPSSPEVPSSPLVYPGAIPLLEEIGVDEAHYASAAVRVRDFVLEFQSSFCAPMQMPNVGGRDYVYGVERVGFDFALWTNLERFTSVTRRSGFKVEALEHDASGRVIGLRGRTREGASETIGARVCVVGADGRHSTIARRVGARVLEQHDRTSTVYQALWEDVRPYPGLDGRTVTHLITRSRGQTILMFPSPNDRNWLIVHTRSDRVEIAGDVEHFYQTALDSYPSVRARLDGARRISAVSGVKRVANCYVESGGPGWLLVGDAVHKKDPIDGQGIYDALLESKLLAAILCRHVAGELDWAAVVSSWARELRAATEAMFRSTLGRLETELYGEPPQRIIDSVIRWILTDPRYQREFMLYLARALPPERWPSKSLMLSACMRGAVADLGRRFTRSRG